jgi:hypothetical protein
VKADAVPRRNQRAREAVGSRGQRCCYSVRSRNHLSRASPESGRHPHPARSEYRYWEDLDCPELQAALHVVGMGNLPKEYLGCADIAIRYKVRDCPERMHGESLAAWLRRAERAQPRLMAAYWDLEVTA